jgi:hypothetical protein
MKLQLPVQSVPITTKAVSSNPVHAWRDVLNTILCDQVSLLRHISGFLWIIRFSPPTKLSATI